MSGLGTSGANTSGVTNVQSQTNPWGPAVPGLQDLVGQIRNQYLGMAAPGNTAQNNKLYAEADKNLSQLPNFGPAAAQTASNILQTGGDPLGILRRESGQIGYGADSPGMKDVLKTIQNDVSNQINGQFAGAGRSLSGLNTQTLARGLSQGEAVPLLNQYNQNIANQMGIQGAAMSNIGQGFNYANMAPGLASQVPMQRNALNVQYRTQPAQLLGAYENLLNPIAGLGGTSQGNQTQTMNGTATASPLTMAGQVGGLLNPFGNLFSSLF